MGTVEQPGLKGSVSWTEFMDQIDAQQALIDEARDGQDLAVAYDEHAVHTWAELLVETFLAPPFERMALEWGTDVDGVAWAVQEYGLTTTENPEYPDLGPVLVRAEIDAASDAVLTQLGKRPEHHLHGVSFDGYLPIETLPSAREIEPDTDVLQGEDWELVACD